MGLPRELKNLYREMRYGSSEKDSLLMLAVTAGHTMGDKAFKKKLVGSTIFSQYIIESYLRGRFRQAFFKNQFCTAPDGIERVPSKLYVGLAYHDRKCIAEFRDVQVPRYFLEKLKSTNEARNAKDVRERNLVERIHAIRAKVYASRTFPPSLRAIIFERDGHCCQECLRGITILRSQNLHLQVDHINAVVDGGLTTYSNGITLCSECNNAKHHTKQYFAAKALVALAAGAQ